MPSVPPTILVLRDYGLRLAEISAKAGVPSLVVLTANSDWNPGHIWLLQTLFLNNINTNCNSFIREWNMHPISGHDTNDMSPQVFLRKSISVPD